MMMRYFVKYLKSLDEDNEKFKIIKNFIEKNSDIKALIQCLITNEIKFEQEKLTNLSI